MKKKDVKTNRLWGMAAVAVLLFVALAVVPVAADNPWYGGNNDTYIPVNDMRTGYGFPTSGTNYYFNLTNVTAGQKALHISDNNATPTGQVTSTTSTAGYFFVTDTGGRQYQDDIILLVAVNSSVSDDLDYFEINLTSSGYTWNVSADGPDRKQSPPKEALEWKEPGISKVYNYNHYLNNGTTGNIYQNWKFAPTANYPIYSGENMATELPFKLLLVDLNVGVIRNYTYNSTLNYTGMAKVNYSITSSLSGDGIVAFNAYAYNNWTNEGPKMINWINQVNTSSVVPDTSASGWKVTF